MSRFSSRLLALLFVAALPSRTAAQERSRCTLYLEGTTSESHSLSIADPVEPGMYVTHMSRGMVGRCGDATMAADSAVDFDRLGRLELFGGVRYRDTIRTLVSERLTYFEAEGRVEAHKDVVLTRLRSGSVLRGPRVEFFRVPERGDRTVATGRPHMTLRGLGSATEPFEVDANRAEFEGEETARAWGQVLIRRSDLEARADSSFFELLAGAGTLHGSPRVRGEAYELIGDSIRVRLEGGELRRVHALGGARATGERFRLRAGQVVADVSEGEVEELAAFGGPSALGVSEGYRLWGDSLHFRLGAGALDSAVAVGRAAAVEERAGDEAEPSLEVGPRLVAGGDRNWVAGDTIRARFEAAGPDSAPAIATETRRERTAEETRRPLEVLRATGRARSYYAAVREDASERRPSRNYLIGNEIVVIFRDGRAASVHGRDAVGVYLDPAGEGEGEGLTAGETR